MQGGEQGERHFYSWNFVAKKDANAKEPRASQPGRTPLAEKLAPAFAPGHLLQPLATSLGALPVQTSAHPQPSPLAPKRLHMPDLQGL